MFRQGYRKKPTHETPCKCSHVRVAHYSKGGHCVFPGCGCLEFRPAGRQEYSTAKRAQCSYGHSHDSGLEIKTCADLHFQKLAGDVRVYRFHPLVDLFGPSGAVIATYEVDFEVELADGSIEYIECKGAHLAREMGWRLKWALLQDKHKGEPKYKFRVIKG